MWAVEYSDAYQRQPGRSARGTIGELPPLEEARPQVENFLNNQWDTMIRYPVGCASRPYFVPGATYDQLWDWDAFFMATASPDCHMDAAVGSLLNLLDGVQASGRPPKRLEADGSYCFVQPLPIHAQFAWMLLQRIGEAAWLAPYWDRLIAIRKWYERETVTGGYYVWEGFRGNGIDNNPSVYGRPPGSSAGVDLASWHVRENLCMAGIADVLGKPGGEIYRAAAKSLSARIRERYWDPSDEFFYAIDCRVCAGETSLQAVTWPTHLKFRSFSGLFPLFLGIAGRAEADAVCRRLLDTEEFLSPAGFRSHSAREGIYNNVPMGNPSNWQGPVWALTTCLGCYGLALYGYVDEAKDVAGRMVRTFAADLRDNGCVHEYYCGDTGQPLSKPGFLSWNLMVGALPGNLEAGIHPLWINL